MGGNTSVEPGTKRFCPLSKNPPGIGGRGRLCFQWVRHALTVCPKTIVYSHMDRTAAAGAELRNGQGRADPLSLEALHCSGRTAFARKLALNLCFPAQRSPLMAPPRQGYLSRYKLHPAASYKARRREIYPQNTVIRGSYPRLKRTYPTPLLRLKRTYIQVVRQVVTEQVVGATSPVNKLTRTQNGPKPTADGKRLSPF